ncbi:hypothetical protein HZB78_04410 [Candidatus Collierbacteria bacterium]|nr:hypothetical protein [Candidatus Collierbacteria bacterium]
MQLSAEQNLRKLVDAPETTVLSSQALQDAYWMKATGMGVYSPDLTQAVSNRRSKRLRGVAIGNVYSAHNRVEAAMLGLGENYGGTK